MADNAIDNETLVALVVAHGALRSCAEDAVDGQDDSAFGEGGLDGNDVLAARATPEQSGLLRDSPNFS